MSKMENKQEIIRDPDVWDAPWGCIKSLVLAIIGDCDNEEDNEEKMSKKLKEGEL